MLLEPFRLYARNRRLIYQLAIRDVSARYRGSAAGLLWSIVAPLCLLLSYQLVFSQVFPAKWPVVPGGVEFPFALLVFAGIVVFAFFADCLGRGPTLISANPNFVKKVVFPIDALAFVAAFVALFHLIGALLVLMLFFLVLTGSVPPSFVFIPLVLLPMVIFSIGALWILSALGTYLKDLQHVVPVVITLLFFFSPVFFPASGIKNEWVRDLLSLNPLTGWIESTRTLLFAGALPSVRSWSTQIAVAWFVFYLGFWLFRRVRPGFADVI